MKRIYSLIKDTEGSIAITMVILMFAFVGILTFVIDLAHLQTAKNELQNAADACALRGARAFVPDNIPLNDQLLDIPPDENRAIGQASLAIGDNKSDDNTFHMVSLVKTGEIQVGIWDYVNRTLLAWEWPPPSSLWGEYIGPGISLPVKRTDGHNQGPVRMTLAQIFNITQVSVSANATAALSGIGGFTPGSPTLPFGTWENQLPDPGQNLHGTFGVDKSDTLGWTNLNPADTNPNANELKTIMNQGALYDCPYGSTVGIQNGVDSSVIKAMTKSGNRFGLSDPNNDKVYEPSTAINPKTDPPVSYADTVYMMPVFSDGTGGLDKYNQSALVGGVPVKILKVADSPGNYIDVQIVGGTYVSPGYGGGRFYGVLSTQPKLVE